MKRFKNILVVAEQDDGQTRSLIYTAVDLARRNGAVLTVFSVVDAVPEQRRYRRRGNSRVDLVGLMKEARVAELQAITPQTEVPVHYEVTSGTPYLEIIERVSTYGHDLVLTVPMPPIRKLGLGSSSTTMHLLRKCPVPVWVHSPLSATADALVVAIGPIDEATDELNLKLLQLGSSLARSTASELHVVHAWRLEGETMLRSPRLAYSTDEIDEMGGEIRLEAESGLHRLLGQIEGAAEMAKIHIRKGHAGDVIPQIINEINPNAIVMGTVARTGIPGLIIGNTAERVLASVNRSVLAVKPSGFVSPVGALMDWHPAQMPY
jgi:nucleotide-binding universal stress UspA family protein